MAGQGKRDEAAGLDVWVHKGGLGLTPASFRWELAKKDGLFDRSFAEGGLGTPMNLLEQMEMWVAEQRAAEGRS